MVGKNESTRRVEGIKLWKGVNKKFTVANLKSNWELIPLFTIPCFAVSIGLLTMYRTATGAPDVRWREKSDGLTTPHDTIKPDQDVKLYTQNPKKFERLRKESRSPANASVTEE